MHIYVTGRLSAEESLFTYPIGLDYSDFNIPGFEPTFLDPDSLLGSSGSALCGTNLECLFDLEVTGDMNLANNTLTSTQEIMENNELFEECKYNIWIEMLKKLLFSIGFAAFSYLVSKLTPLWPSMRLGLLA